MASANTRPLQIMEVCGTYHAIFKFGLDRLLPEEIELFMDRCPVCVLPMGRIDACLESQPVLT